MQLTRNLGKALMRVSVCPLRLKEVKPPTFRVMPSRLTFLVGE